jgi:hypothetical protein
MADNFKGFDEETTRRVSNIGDAIKEIRQQTQDLNKELIKAGGPLTDWESSFNTISSLSRRILDTQGKSLLSSKGTTAALKAQNEARNAARALDIKINELLNSKVNGETKLNALIDRRVYLLGEAKDQAKMLAYEYKNLAQSAAALDKRTIFFSKMAEFVKDVRGLRAFASPFEAAAEASRKQVLRNADVREAKNRISQSGLTNYQLQTGSGLTKKRLEALGLTDITGSLRGKEAAAALRKATTGGGSAFGAGAKAFGGEIAGGISGFFKGGGWIGALLQLIAKVAQFIKDAMFAADERVTKLAKGMMLTKDEARGVYNSLKDTKLEMDSIYNTTKDVTEAYTDLIELTDFVTSATNEMIETQIILTKNLDLSKEEAFGVQEAFVASNIEADKGKDIVYDQIAAFANQNKLLTAGKKVFADIAKTSKLIQINFNGNLGSLVKTTLEAKKLGLTLDQVSKIGKSLLNFEQSISSELEAELLTGRDLNLERARAYALNHDIAGLTQEISKQGITQEKFAKMNVIQQEAIAGSLGMSAEEMADMLYKQKVLNKVGGETLKNLRERARVSEDINLQNKVAALEQGILSGKSLEQAEKSTTAQEKFNQALERAKEAFTDFVDGEYLEDLAAKIKDFVDFITGSSEEEREARKQARQLEVQAKTEEEKANIQQLKKQAMYQGPGWAGSAMTAITSVLPGFSGINFVKDLANVKLKEEAISARKELESRTQSQSIPAKDFVIKTLPEDTVVAAGGTSLGSSKEMVQLLKEQNRLLTGILNKEGTIVLNGTKMGTAMAVGGYKVQ